MSVIVKNNSENFFKVFSKGAPEKIKEMCREETIPTNFNEMLTKYTKVISFLNVSKERITSPRALCSSP